MILLHKKRWQIGFICWAALSSTSSAFAPTLRAGVSTKNVPREVSQLHVSNFYDDVPIDLTKSFVLTKEEINPLIKLNKDGGKEKWINAYGAFYVIASIITLPLWWTAMTITNAVCNAFPDLDPHRSFYDTTGKIWAKAFLTLTNSFPTFSGDIERLNDNSGQKACLYVANHASWLDIPVLCTILSPLFKFIAKGELLKVPCIGKQLSGVS